MRSEKRFEILLVDDDAVLLETTLASLEEKHEVVGTTRPKRALELIAKRQFDIIVLDWMMPEMDGLELFRRASLIDDTLVGLLVTGRMEEFSVEVARDKRKMLALLSKPYRIEDLLDRIDVLGRVSAMKKQIRRLKKLPE